ncbi:hypothetical protein B0H16DRAFT_1847859, partial [Mycena metata]
MDDIPFDRKAEVVEQMSRAHLREHMAALRRSARLHNPVEQRDRDVAVVDAAAESEVGLEREKTPEDDIDIFHSRPRNEKNTPDLVLDKELRPTVKAGYKDDKFFSKVISDPKLFAMFELRDELIYTRNRGGEEVLCIPDVMVGEYRLQGTLIEQAHATIGHFATQRTGDYLR